MFIYKTTNKITGLIYVGKLIKDCNTYLGSGKLLKIAIKECGKENFEREIIEFCSSKEELCLREKYWIKKFDARNPKIGYNIAKGGNGGQILVHSEETKRKIGLANSIALKGKKFTEERRLRFSKSISGEKNPFYGKKHSKETREKISLKQLGIKRGKYSAQRRKNISDSLKGKPKSEQAKLNMSNGQKKYRENLRESNIV